jgi:hypothetical protein
MTIASSSRSVLFLLGIAILALAEAAIRYVRSIPMLTGIALLYVSFCGLIFVPVLGVVGLLVGGDLSGAISTLAVFAVAFLAVVMARRRAFTFVGALVVWIYVGIFLSIVLGVIFNVSPESMGTALVSFLIGCVLLYQTSEMLERYSGDRHIAAALDILLGMSIFWIFVRRRLRPVTPWSS